MPRWLVIVLVSSLGLCLVCGSLGYFVAWPKVKSSISEGQAAVAGAMADSVAAAVTQAIAAQSPLDGELVLTPTDLDVNNAAFDDSSECGYNVTNNRATVYGVTTSISPTGLSIVCLVTYSSVPVITGDRVDLTQITVSESAARFLFSKERFEEAMENGINRALATAGLTPTALTLDRGSLTIETVQTV